MARQFFLSLFTEECYNRPLFPLRGLFPALSADSVKELEASVSMEEVKLVVFSMGAFKAPGPDGLHALFYQSQWSSVGVDVFKFVEDIFAGGSMTAYTNQTLITLIPKVEHPELIQ